MALPTAAIHPAATCRWQELLAQCDVRFLRRSGPGGQHRNKVSTAVVLVHRPTGIKAEANERRSQAENRTAALRRLRVQLALEVRRRREPGDSPSPLWQSRLHGGRIEVSLCTTTFRRCWPRRWMRWRPAGSTRSRPRNAWDAARRNS